MTRVRVRQHVNPCSRKYQTSLTSPDWSQIYLEPDHKLHLDIGCARGRFLLNMAPLKSDCNFLGVEIRESLVTEANFKAQQLGLLNLYYLFCNINTSLDTILQSLPPGRLSHVTIQFPDPWFKNRHAKRRVVQPELVESLSRYLVEGGSVFLQSDVLMVAEEMVSLFANNPRFQKTHIDWLASNPFCVPTERELATIAKGEPVYRALFVKH